MKSWLPYLLMPVAVYAGYLLPRPTADPHTDVSAESYPQRNPREAQKPFRIESSRIQSIADSISQSSGSFSTKKVPVVATADIPSVITHLLGQAGPSGLSWPVRSEINSMLERWAEEDFPGALAWAESYPVQNAAKDFLEAILSKHGATNFDATMEVVQRLREEHKPVPDIGHPLFDEASKRGARQAFDLLAAFPADNSGYSGSSAAFPIGFDFRTFAELSASHLKGSNDPGYRGFSYFPTNLMEEWAKVDATAALEFCLANDELPFNDLGDITATFLDLTNPQSSNAWIVEQYASLDREQRARFAGSLNSVFPDKMGAAPLIHLVNSITDPSMRKEIATDMLKSFGHHDRNGSAMYLDLITALPDPGERLDVIHRAGLTHLLQRTDGDRKLEAYGITKEQVDRLMSQQDE